MMSEQFRIFPESLEYFLTACKNIGHSGELPDSLADSWLELKVSRQFGRFKTDFKLFGNISRQSGLFAS